MSDLDARVAALRREGRQREAAALCEARGELRLASELLAEVWDFRGAVDAAARAGLYDVAYAHALASGERGLTEDLHGPLAERPDQALTAASHAETRGRLHEAARLCEAAGEVEPAAALFERAGELFDAARLQESQGRYREAGILYERRAREVPEDAEAALRLGRILASFGRFDHAARALQQAAQDPERRADARRLLIACFAAMGLSDAASSTLDDLRGADPAAPPTVDALLRAEHGSERGLLAAGRGDQESLLAGRYRVVRSLGAGATGRVLLARDVFYDRDVAVKVLTVGGGEAGRDAYARFAREARVAAGVDHPNIVRVFEFNPDGPFLVMELMGGGTLEDRLGDAAAGLPLPVVRHVAVSILAGLSAVHRRGVIHRDLKPSNVFFGHAGDVKLGDFGVAHLADLGATLTGAMMGTLAYMAPEQITGATLPDASTDLYALGVVLHRMLTGALPFPGPDFVSQHLGVKPPPPSERAPALGPRFDGLVARLLCKEPAGRLRSATDVVAQVEALDWTPPGSSPAPGVTREAAARPSSIPPAAGDGAARYVEPEPLGPGLERLRDRVLDRPVLRERCSAARAERLRALAAADHPFLQAVYDLDPETREAILERPSGAPLDAHDRRDPVYAAALACARQALAHLHARGLVHGALTPARVLVADGRATLLLPPGDAAPADPAADLAALALIEG